MINLVVHFSRHRLSSREHWESVARDRQIPLVLPHSFDPQAYPLCERSQVNHPDWEFAVLLGDATCRFQLDHYEFDPGQLTREQHRAAMQGCNRSLAFRWNQVNRPGSVAAHLMAATLALAADGVVFWQRAKDGTCKGAEAFKVLSAKAYREIKGPGHRFSKANPFGPPMEVTPSHSDRCAVQCPRCGLSFGIDNRQVFDGEKHLMCGQMIIVTDVGQ